MDSRRVIFLTEGYLSGWLDFEYKTPTSKLREEYLLAVQEKRVLERALSMRVLLDASYSVSLGSQDSFNSLKESYGKYMALILPYLSKEGKMEAEPVTKENIAHWKAVAREIKNLHKTK